MQLELGTVQFGMPTTEGRLSVEEARRILTLAQEAGIHMLDDSSKNANSEAILAETLTSDSQFRLVTRMPALASDAVSRHQTDLIKNEVRRSLDFLGQTRFYGMLVTDLGALLNPGGEYLLTRMRALKEQGLVEKLGVSVSTAADVERVLGRFTPDIVQVPLNVLDQRIHKSGHLQKLKDKGVEIHARGIFLQGVLLDDPAHLHPWFWPARNLIESYHRFLVENGMTPIEGALDFIKSIPEVDYALVGVGSVRQLREIVDAHRWLEGQLDYGRFASTDERIINPHRWNLYE